MFLFFLGTYLPSLKDELYNNKPAGKNKPYSRLELEFFRRSTLFEEYSFEGSPKVLVENGVNDWVES